MVEDRHEDVRQSLFEMGMKLGLPKGVAVYLSRLSVTARVALAVHLLNSSEAALRKGGGLALLADEAEVKSWEVE